MSANLRIQWLHRKIAELSYPNAKRLSERFGISHRQAQRDVDFLKNKLGAPIRYNFEHKGFYYTTAYSLPVALTSDNDEDYTGVVAAAASEKSLSPAVAESTVIQTQLPYSATVSVDGRLTAIELQPFIKERNKDGSYLCEFHSIEKFMGVILALDADIRIVKPSWLRSRIVRAAERIIRNNVE